MNCFGGRDILTDQFVVVFSAERGPESLVARIGADGSLQWEARQEGAYTVPTIRLDIEAARQLGLLLHTHGLTPAPPDDLTPTKAHLADAVAVRDRLLALVERP